MDFPQKSHRFPVRLPEHSEALAEFCGVMLGDGGIAPYQIRVTLHAIEEPEYGSYVVELAKDLFGVTPRVYRRDNCQGIDIVLSRVEIVEYLVSKCGLSKGNKVKQQVNIPSWIRENRSFRIACLRGLFDTDGSVFEHMYLSKGKPYTYKKLGFTSASLPLLESVHHILNAEGIRNRYGSRHDVRVDSRESVKRYFDLVGSHNPKHLKRYST